MLFIEVRLVHATLPLILNDEEVPNIAMIQELRAYPIA